MSEAAAGVVSGSTGAGRQAAGTVRGSSEPSEVLHDGSGRGGRLRRSAAFLLDAALGAAGAGLRIVFHLGGWGLIRRAGKAAGRLRYATDGACRRETELELERLLGAGAGRAALAATARRSFEVDAMRLFETAFFGCLDRRSIEELARVEGLEHVDAALARGRGVILLLSHFGSFLLPLPFLGFRGYAVRQITGRQVHAGLLAERIWRWRKAEADRLPVKFMQVERFLRPVYRALRDNEVVAIAFDGRDSTQWAVVDFFGRRARFSSGPFELARRVGAAIVPTFVIREPGGRHRIRFEPAFERSAGTGGEADLAADVARFAKLFEGYVARYPCHFGMVLGKLRRAGEADPAAALFVDGE